MTKRLTSTTFSNKFKSTNQQLAPVVEESKSKIQHEVYEEEEEDDEDEQEDEDTFIDRQIKELTKAKHNNLLNKAQSKTQLNEPSDLLENPSKHI